MAERAVDLDRAVEHVHVGGHDLDLGDLLSGGALALGIHLPGGVHGHEPGAVDLDPRASDEVLEELLIGQRAAEGLALDGTLAHELERALGAADGPHAVVDTPRAEAVLRDGEASALLAE